MSEAPHLDGSVNAPAFSDDPGLWDIDHPSPERISQLESMLEADTLPAFGRIHLL